MEKFSSTDCLSFPWGTEKSMWQITFLVALDPKIPDWLIKMIFLEEVEITIRLGIKSRFGIMGFSTSDAIWGL